MTVQEIVPGVARPPRRSDYEQIVRGLRPHVGEEELTLRSSLLLMRDMAMGRKNSACEPAWMILDVIERIATENGMNHRVDVETLRELRRICLSCACAASSLDTLFAPPLPLDQGGADARHG